VNETNRHITAGRCRQSAAQSEASTQIIDAIEPDARSASGQPEKNSA